LAVKDITMTKGELNSKHVESALGYRRIGDSPEYQVRARLIAKSATAISIEYAISVLEDLKSGEWSISPHDRVDYKIDELKSLINQ
jgi:hypothetical protein